LEMDVHSRTAGFGERRRAAAGGVATLGPTQRARSPPDGATAGVFRYRASGPGPDGPTGARGSVIPAASVSVADPAGHSRGANALSPASTHHHGSGCGSLHRG